MNWQAVAVVIFAPLIGAFVYAIQTGIQWMAFEPAGSGLATAVFFLIPFGWAFGLALNIIVGLPVGIVATWSLRRLRLETKISYAVTGALAAFLFSLALPSRSEFWLGMTVTGLVMGLGFWTTVRSGQLERAR